MLSPSVSPQEFDQWFTQAHALQQAGQWAAAQAMYQQLLLLDPTNSGIMINSAGIHLLANQLPEALALLEQSLALNPQEAYAHCAYADVLMRLKRYDDARAAYDQAIRLRAEVAMFYSRRGIVHLEQQRAQDALADHNQAIALDPIDADAQNNRGNALAQLKRHAEALSSYAQACTLATNNAVSWNNRGAMLRYFNRFNEALACYSHALTLDPNYRDGFINRGILLGDMRQFDDAFHDFERALAIDPTAVEAAWNKGLLLLTLGDFTQGWPLFEVRWNKPAFKAQMKRVPQPLWQGETPLTGKTILLHPEQGLGDYLQCCRYVPLLEAHGARVVLECPAALTLLLSSLSPSITVIEKDTTLPAFDVHCPIMSLPFAFKTALETIPRHTPYLWADPTKSAAWHSALGEKTQLRIGLSWSGAPGHTNDHHRSMGLGQLAPLWELPLSYISLQKDVRPEDQPLLHHIQTALEPIHDFADTAALIDQMDLVLCVDSSVAHAAGALGKPVWLMLPYVPDFRWLLNCDTSPWYPTMRIFRQPTPGDWASVIAEVQTALRTFKNNQSAD